MFVDERKGESHVNISPPLHLPFAVEEVATKLRDRITIIYSQFPTRARPWTLRCAAGRRRRVGCSKLGRVFKENKPPPRRDFPLSPLFYPYLICCVGEERGLRGVSGGRGWNSKSSDDSNLLLSLLFLRGQATKKIIPQ